MISPHIDVNDLLRHLAAGGAFDLRELVSDLVHFNPPGAADLEIMREILFLIVIRKWCRVRGAHLELTAKGRRALERADRRCA